MQVLDITADCLDREYHGCGRAWAAVKNGQVFAIRYMSGEGMADDLARKLASDKPAWVKAVAANCQGIDDRGLPTAWSSLYLAKLAAAAAVCSDCPKPPRKPQYRPKELLSMARAALAAFDAAWFGRYREACRAELAAIGELKSGMCSCTKFCAE